MKGKSLCFLLFSILLIFGAFSAILYYLPLNILPLYGKELKKNCSSHQVEVPLILVITACVSAILCASLNFIFLVGVFSASRKKIDNLLNLIKIHWYELMDMLLRVLVPKKLLNIVKNQKK